VQNIKENPTADSQLATVNADSAKADSDITSLLSIQNTITKDTEAVSNSDLDIQSQKLAVENAQNSLQDAKDNLANYYIYAPFGGTLGKISTQVGTTVGSGTSIATILTTQKICTIPLNEVDVAKVQPGQKVVLTFDALPDLTVAGQVATIDPVGTISSGVVTYNVQISFDTQDSRVKSGMSINANIITNVKQDVLLVPNTAVKTQGNIKYVQILVNGAPQQKIVTTGLSDDTNTEIVTGISEGDKVVTQTVTSGSTTGSASTTRSAASTVRIPGLGGGGGFGGGR
jgi:RND family efflux transporter MFP subunit